MKIRKTLKFLAVTALFAVTAYAVGLYSGSMSVPVSAQEPEVQYAQAAPQENGDQQQADATYNYVAQSGDSYSLMARKAIQTYGITSNTSLSHAQIIFAETNMTQEAGSPLLLLDQKVSIKESTVKGWADKAKDLSDAQKQAWDAYAQGADFNTNNVGE